MKLVRQLKVTQVDSEFSSPYEGQIINAEHAYKIFKDIADWSKEGLIGVYLNEKYELVCYSLLALGAKNCVRLPHHEIFEHVILAKATAFILIHNHPKGNPAPSGEDRQRMIEISKQSEILHLKFTDFVIIGYKKYWAMSMER